MHEGRTGFVRWEMEGRAEWASVEIKIDTYRH